MERPIPFIWDGESMTPINGYWAREADKRFVVGAVHCLQERLERSAKSHRFFFAEVKTAWDNLPEDQAERFPTPEHLRAYALIKTGWHDKADFVASSKAEALRMAAFLRPIDEYSIVLVKDNIVSRFTAKSQAYRAMNKKDFQASKDAVLDYVSGLCGISVEELNTNTDQAA